MEASPKPVVEPVNLGPVINTKLREAEPSFTADGKTMYFNCQMRPGPAGNDICASRLIGALEGEKGTRTFSLAVNASLVRVCHAGEKQGARSKERIANGEWRIANSQELRAKGKEQGAGSREQGAKS